MGARRSLPHGTHETVPRDGGEEDWGASPPPGGGLRTPVREDPDTTALPRACHRRATDSCACLQGEFHGGSL